MNERLRNFETQKGATKEKLALKRGKIRSRVYWAAASSNSGSTL